MLLGLVGIAWMNLIYDSTHLVGKVGGYNNANHCATLHMHHNQASFIQHLSWNIVIMVRFYKMTLSDIVGMVILTQTRQINKYISEQININLYITQQSN